MSLIASARKQFQLTELKGVFLQLTNCYYHQC